MRLYPNSKTPAWKRVIKVVVLKKDVSDAIARSILPVGSSLAHRISRVNVDVPHYRLLPNA